MSNNTDNNYRIYNIPQIKNEYTKLLGLNLNSLIGNIYSNPEEFSTPEIRAALSLNMILISKNLVSSELSAKIGKDLDTLRKDSDYLNKWPNPSLKRQYLKKEIETLNKHTEIDDTITLNSCQQESASMMPTTVYDIRSGVETVNPINTVPTAPKSDECCLM